MKTLSFCLGLTLVLSGTPALFAEQSRTVTGRVISGWSGQPLERAIVYLTDSFEQAVTNQRGEFSIAVPTHDVELLVQAVAYHENRLHVPSGQTRIETRLHIRGQFT